MEKIVSLQNAKVKKWTSLHHKKDRDQLHLFLAEGEHLIGEALSAGCAEEIITDTVSPYDSVPVYEVTPAIMKKISANVSPVHLIAVCRQKEAAPDELKRVILLDDVQDPGNLGTLVRTAVSFSYDAVCCSLDTCDLYNEKAVRSTQGALFHIPVIRGNLKDIILQLQKDDFQVIATSLEKSHTMAEIPTVNKMAFIFGNEGQGVHPQIQAMADDRLRIDMHGFESLNVAVAGGIVMHNYRG
ncbi:MAG: RNA methyltransferase [Solobacterium sp.]|jgi:TrmH family RNA methyltransferase|nr:RNA methyltransferase [Solobacterium sp.]MCH4206176.1 RNA methyltransferase [Solobacterium sp.]MCH4227642.1 RNA methyltransferase [Solobacterium sp.]MCH4283069.1 RNA methyltransferase [Solobacterium sp.]